MKSRDLVRIATRDTKCPDYTCVRYSTGKPSTSTTAATSES